MELKRCDFPAPDSLEGYVAGGPANRTEISLAAALEETFFLGLRLTCGIDLRKVAVEFGEDADRKISRDHC